MEFTAAPTPQSSLTSSGSADSDSHLVANICSNAPTNALECRGRSLKFEFESFKPTETHGGIQNSAFVLKNQTDMCHLEGEQERRRSAYAIAYAEMLTEDKNKVNINRVRPRSLIQTSLTKDERWVSTLQKSPTQSSHLPSHEPLNNVVKAKTITYDFQMRISIDYF